MLAAAAGGDIGHGALDELEQGLLHALARDVAGDRDVARGPRHLVDLVDVDDAHLGAGNVEISVLQQAQDEILDVLADVAGLGEGGGVADGEGDVEQLGQAARDGGLAAAGGAEEEDVRFLEVDLLGLAAVAQALVVVVDGDGDGALGAVLADDVLVEVGLDLAGVQDLAETRVLGHALALVVVAQKGRADVDALIADEDARRAGDEAVDLCAAASAEAAVIDLAVVATGLLGHPRRLAGGQGLGTVKGS